MCELLKARTHTHSLKVLRMSTWTRLTTNNDTIHYNADKLVALRDIVPNQKTKAFLLSITKFYLENGYLTPKQEKALLKIKYQNRKAIDKEHLVI